MAEQVIVNIVPGSAGVSYRPDTPEASLKNEMYARELALQTLADQAIRLRMDNGLPVNPALVAIYNARTYLELV